MRGAIYKITNPKGNIYIGKTINISNRIKDYKYLKCKAQPKIYNSIRKYGWENHKFEIILKTDNLEIAEIKLIEYYNSFNKGLNLTFGGDGAKGTDKLRERLSILHKGNTYRKGKKVSEEGRINIASGRLGKPSNHRVPILQYDKKLNFIQSWNTLTEASLKNNVLITSITNNLTGRSNSAGDFIWKYK